MLKGVKRCNPDSLPVKFIDGQLTGHRETLDGFIRAYFLSRGESIGMEKLS